MDCQSHLILNTGFTAKPLYCPSYRTLNREEAKSRVQRLTPGSAEHSQLQNVLLQTSGIFEICLQGCTYKVHSSLKEEALRGGFGSAEHVAIGEAVVLQGLGKNDTLLLKGVQQIKFHQIVALAGDFYGRPGEAISLPGGSQDDKTTRFQRAFDTLATANNDEIRRIILEVEAECKAVKHSALPHHCYSHQMIEKNRAIKKIKADIDELLIDNSDHFSSNAKDAYHIGHALARKKAAEAGKKKDIEGLKSAYALDAFACHFLTDLFAAGHIRNQRGQLETFLVSTLKIELSKAKKFAGILTGAQHQKDGDEGLNVKNGKGEFWRAYGDGHFYSPKNTENKEMVIKATQASVDEVYAAFAQPDVLNPSLMDDFIPSVEDCLNPSPLYFLNEGSSELHLHINGETVAITSESQYLSKAILTQALKYLPEEYIHGFINPLQLQMPPVIEKVIFPAVERLTGVLWRTLGMATYHQVKQETKIINSKIDELSGVAHATYDNTLVILKKLEKMDSKLSQLVRSKAFSELEEAIKWMADVAFLHKAHTAYGLNPEQRKTNENRLFDAYTRIGRIFTLGTADERNILYSYTVLLQEEHPEMSPAELRVAVTHWFRQMLDHEVHAFNLYALYAIARLNPRTDRIEKETIENQLLTFQQNLAHQIDNNRDFAEPLLLCEPEPYIMLQLEKSKTKRIAFSKILK